ncbi:hypothetical protein G6L37_07335 [Agrobacterium rubi]|nr:hypothetical protein [Agrobacterium rubi]NTF25180.1 hypothetical protein [Agrobacterium rubi]
MTRQMRVRRLSSRTKFESRQLLQEKRWWGWNTLDYEDIPSHVLISLGAFGDRGGWVSKFASIGSFGSNGVFTPHDPSAFERWPDRAVAAVRRIASLLMPGAKREVEA